MDNVLAWLMFMVNLKPISNTFKLNKQNHRKCILSSMIYFNKNILHLTLALLIYLFTNKDYNRH